MKKNKRGIAKLKINRLVMLLFLTVLVLLLPVISSATIYDDGGNIITPGINTNSPACSTVQILGYLDSSCIDAGATTAAALHDADVAALAAGKTLAITRNYTIDSAVTLNSAVSIRRGGGFTRSGSGTLALAGNFDAPSTQQAFFNFPAGSISISTMTPKISVAWFGVVSDTTINAAIMSLPTTSWGITNYVNAQSTIYIPDGSYTLANPVNLKSNVNIDAPNASFTFAGTGGAFQLLSGANATMTTLSGAIGTGNTSITVAAGTGLRLANPAVGSYYAVMWHQAFANAHLDPNFEIVLVTARTNDTFTITRAQSTSASTFTSGDYIAMTMVDNANINIGTIKLTNDVSTSYGFYITGGRYNRIKFGQITGSCGNICLTNKAVYFLHPTSNVILSDGYFNKVTGMINRTGWAVDMTDTANPVDGSFQNNTFNIDIWGAYNGINLVGHVASSIFNIPEFELWRYNTNPHTWLNMGSNLGYGPLDNTFNIQRMEAVVLGTAIADATKEVWTIDPTYAIGNNFTVWHEATSYTNGYRAAFVNTANYVFYQKTAGSGNFVRHGSLSCKTTAQTGTSYTVTDNDCYVVFNNDNPVTVTLPVCDTSINGHPISFGNVGAGTVTINRGSSNVLLGGGTSSSNITLANNQTASMWCDGAAHWWTTTATGGSSTYTCSPPLSCPSSTITIDTTGTWAGNAATASALVGTLPDTQLSSNVTKAGNTFNGPSQLLLLDSSGLVPSVNLPATSGTLTTYTYIDGGSW